MLSTWLLTLLLFALLAIGYRYVMRPWPMAAAGLGCLVVLVISADRLSLQPFTWVKAVTLVFSIFLFATYVSSSGGLQRYLGVAVFGTLLLNIFEAVVVDATSGHYLNAAVGLSLMASQPGPSKISKATLGRPALRYDLPLSWILAYTAWNLTVVCGHYPLRLLDHAAVLAAPLAIALLGDRQRWLEARCFTLSTLTFSVILTVDLFKGPWMEPVDNAQGLHPWLSAIGAILAAMNLAMAFRANAGIRPVFLRK